MMFFKLTILILILTLAEWAAAAPVGLYKRAQYIFIGYRVVSAAQAANYKRAGNTLTPDPNLVAAQTGPGVYTSAVSGRFPGANPPWYCLIQADRAAIDRVSKAWVPQFYNGKRLWYDSAAIDAYIKKLEGSWDPAKTLRLSILDGGTGYDDVQLSIPFALLNSNRGDLGISTICSPDRASIPSARVNYDAWEKNIKGNRQ